MLAQLGRTVPYTERVWRTCDVDGADGLMQILSSVGGAFRAEELLLSYPELARRRDERGLLAIHVAALKGHIGVIQLLLEMDRNLVFSTSSSSGMTPLHYAVLGDHLSIVKTLLNAGGAEILQQRSSPSSMAPQGHTPAELAAKYNHTEILEVLSGAAPSSLSFKHLVRWTRQSQEESETLPRDPLPDPQVRQEWEEEEGIPASETAVEIAEIFAAAPSNTRSTAPVPRLTLSVPLEVSHRPHPKSRVSGSLSARASTCRPPPRTAPTTAPAAPAAAEKDARGGGLGCGGCFCPCGTVIPDHQQISPRPRRRRRSRYAGRRPGGVSSSSDSSSCSCSSPNGHQSPRGATRP